VQFQRFQPRVKLSEDEIWRIREFCRLHSWPVVSSRGTGHPSIPLAQQPDDNGDGSPSAGTSLVLQLEYTTSRIFRHQFDSIKQ